MSDTSTPEPVAHLRRLRAAAAAGRPLDPATARWIEQRLGRYLADAPQGLTLDRALDLQPMPGQESWWTLERRARRDDAIRRLRRALCPTASTATAAAIIAETARRYAAAGWRLDRDKDVMPPAYVGSPKALLWEAMRAHPRFPFSARQLTAILDADRHG